ncbi:MAG: uroporphyrinogen-III synthase [Gemmatimonadales bacterium]
MITRPAEKAERLAERLRALGAVPIVFPTIRLEPADPGPMDAAARDIDSFDWVVFTSRQGVKSFVERLQAVGRQASDLSSRRVAAIGPATADELRALGVAPALVPAEYVAESILAEIGDVKGRRILLPRADIARAALADGLKERGATVVEIAAYRTVGTGARPPALDGVDAVTFTSSSTVRYFVDSGAALGSARVVCIGPVTAGTARELGLTVHAVAEEYTEDGLILALEGVFRS